jgi:hypothetical protein
MLAACDQRDFGAPALDASIGPRNGAAWTNDGGGSHRVRTMRGDRAGGFERRCRPGGVAEREGHAFSQPI